MTVKLLKAEQQREEDARKLSVMTIIEGKRMDVVKNKERQLKLKKNA